MVVSRGLGATSQTKQKTRTANKDEGFEADIGEQDLETILKWRTNVCFYAVSKVMTLDALVADSCSSKSPPRDHFKDNGMAHSRAFTLKPISQVRKE